MTADLVGLADRLDGALRKLRERGERTETQMFVGKVDLLLANELEPLFAEAATELRALAGAEVGGFEPGALDNAFNVLCMVVDGRISGRISEWPQLVPSIKWAIERIAAKHEEKPTESDKDIAVAQAVEFAEYVERQAKGEMVKAARKFLSVPYAQEIATRLTPPPGSGRGGVEYTRDQRLQDEAELASGVAPSVAGFKASS